LVQDPIERSKMCWLQPNYRFGVHMALRKWILGTTAYCSLPRLQSLSFLCFN